MNNPDRLEVVAWPWPEITPSHDLTALVAACPGLSGGDVVALTSKVVSKAEASITSDTRSDVISRDTRRTVATRGESVIAQTAHGLVLAAAGVDASNVAAGRTLSLPVDPDGTARAIRAGVWAMRGINVAVVITDTAGRAWRMGQADLAIGCAGIPPLLDLRGTKDTFGNVLSVTAPALADEIASVADLVKGKVSGRPVAVIRGLGDLVLAPGDDGPGAAQLIRDASTDLFGLGARDAVVAAALRSDRVALHHFPRRIPSDPQPFAGLMSAHKQVSITVDSLDSGRRWGVQIDVHDEAGPAAWVEAGRLQERSETLAAAYRLTRTGDQVGSSTLARWRSLSSNVWVVA